MKSREITISQKRALAYATIIALLLGAIFLRHYFIMFVLASIAAYLFQPVYRFLNKHMSDSASAALTLLATFLAITIPIVLITLFAYAQLSDTIKSLSSLNSADIGNFGNKIIELINNLLSNIPFVTYRVTESSLIVNVQTILRTVGTQLLSYFANVASSFFSLFTSLIIYIFIFLSVIKNSDKLISIFRELNPLGDAATDLYLKKTGAMVKGTVFGQFVIALSQGFADTLILYLTGLHGYFFILFPILSVLSIIPLGAGIIVIPIGVIMMLFGNFWGGLIVILWHMFVTSTIDNILKPKLVPKEVKLDPALMTVAVFSGLGLFGFIGLVIGPVIVILIVTTVETYLKVYRNFKLKNDVFSGEEGRSFFGKIGDFGDKLLGREDK